MDKIVISGHVRTACGGAVVPFAKVFACYSDWSNIKGTKADADGYYHFTEADDLLEGRHTLVVVSDGFEYGNASFIVCRDPSSIDVFLSVLPEIQKQSITLSDRDFHTATALDEL